MNRTEKTEAVGSLHQAFLAHPMVIVTHYMGMTVAEMTEFRRRMRNTGASFKVAKNRLSRIALKGTPFEGLDRFLQGPTAIAFTTDPVASAKAVLDYAKINDKLKILGAGLGPSTIDRDGIEALSKMPPIEELRAKILGVLVQPATRLAVVLNAPASKLARQINAPVSQLVTVIQAYSQKQGEDTTAEAA